MKALFHLFGLKVVAEGMHTTFMSQIVLLSEQLAVDIYDL